MREKPLVYVGMSVDILHHGHVNIIEEAHKLGDVVVGLLTDSAISEFKRIPYLEYSEREKIVRRFVGVVDVVPQETWDYAPNISKLRPDYMVHGDDWLSGSQTIFRDNAISALNTYGGQLIEIPYTTGVSCSSMYEHYQSGSIPADRRAQQLRRLLQTPNITRIIETHSPVAAMIAENASVLDQLNRKRFFHGFWSSSLTDSCVRGVPDTEVLSLADRLVNIDQILDVTTKPLIMDGDTGGRSEHLTLNIKAMCRRGVSAVIFEDKTGLKRNSLFGTDVLQELEDVDTFAEKIRLAVEAKTFSEFMVIARLESLIAGMSMDDAILRANAYVQAGADGIMIHSRQSQPDEVIEFCRLFRAHHEKVPLIAVPSSYNGVTEDELSAAGVNIVIYANHLFRASYKAMLNTAESILSNGRSFEIDKDLISIKEALSLIPGT